MKEQWAAMEPARETGDRLLESGPLAGDEMSSPPGKAFQTQVKTSCFPNKSGWRSFPDLHCLVQGGPVA